MYRVALTAGIATAFAGCSLGSSSISSGFAENQQSHGLHLASPLSKASALAANQPCPRGCGGMQLAKLDDKAPTGTFEKAPPAFSPIAIIRKPSSTLRWRATSSMPIARKMA